MSEDQDIDPYVYPGTIVLINKFGIRDRDELEFRERAKTSVRAEIGIPTGNFDLAHLCAIHKHLFQDVYEWAGEVRTLEINKGGHQFIFRQFIDKGMADVHRRILAADYFRGLKLEEFAAKVGPIIGDVNHVHPFREGNGRTQMQYLKQLSAKAGHELDLNFIDRNSDRWIAASIDAHHCHYTAMSREIERGLLDTRASLERAYPDRLAARLKSERELSQQATRNDINYSFDR